MVRLEDEREIAKRFDSVSNLKIRYSIIDEVRSSPGGILGKNMGFCHSFWDVMENSWNLALYHHYKTWSEICSYLRMKHHNNIKHWRRCLFCRSTSTRKVPEGCSTFCSVKFFIQPLILTFCRCCNIVCWYQVCAYILILYFSTYRSVLLYFYRKSFNFLF